MKALIVVDMQNDFMPDGPLGVPGADKLTSKINKLMPTYPLVVASKDWHPEKHVSFHDWPIHCVQNTEGAEFVSNLDTTYFDHVIEKGVDRDLDSYSAFFDNAHKRSTGLGEFLKKRGVEEVHIVGVATDYCVLFTALDALDLGFSTCVIKDCCAPIAEEKEAFEKIEERGGKIITS